jgi:uncharacterized protein (DUF3820 family)
MMDSNILLQLVRMPMPFGKYKGRLLCDLPISYLEWFQRKGFPKGKLGMLLQTMYEIKLNGLDSLLVPIKQMVQDETKNQQNDG